MALFLSPSPSPSLAHALPCAPAIAPACTQTHTQFLQHISEKRIEAQQLEDLNVEMPNRQFYEMPNRQF